MKGTGNMASNESLTGYETFMDNLIFLRIHNHFSKEKMASLLGISVYTLNRLERHEIPPRLKINIFLHIHKHFGVLPSVILTQKLTEF